MSRAGLNAPKRSCCPIHLNVPCRPKRSKAFLLSYTFKCPLKKTQSFCPCSRALNRSAKVLTKNSCLTNTREHQTSNCSFTKEFAALKVTKTYKKIVQNSERDKVAMQQNEGEVPRPAGLDFSTVFTVKRKMLKHYRSLYVNQDSYKIYFRNENETLSYWTV
jgi:hypothetical protein